MTSQTRDPHLGSRATRLPRSARRDQLLAAAQEVFVAQGYHAAGMDEIAERAGVSKPVLYQHFPGKLDLYLVLLGAHCDALVQQVHAALDRSIENRDRIDGALRAYFEFIDHESEAFRLVFESDLLNEEPASELIERMERACVTAIADTITMQTGVPAEHAQLLAASLVGAASAAARFWLASGRQVTKAEAGRLIAALSWRGIAGFPVREPRDLPAPPPGRDTLSAATPASESTKP